MLESGSLAPAILIPALALAVGGAIAEAVLFRGLFDLARELALPGQRIAASIAVIVLSAALLLLEIPIFASGLRLGRQLENRLRMAFLGKIPRRGDRYFQSRLTSDMAERSQTTQRLRNVLDLGRQLLRAIGDPVNRSLSQYRALAAAKLDLVNQDGLVQAEPLRCFAGALCHG